MRSRWRETAIDRGVVAVELALALPLLMLFVFGIVDFGRGFNEKMQMTEAARQGVRAAALTPPPADGAAAGRQMAKDVLRGLRVTEPIPVQDCSGGAEQASVAIENRFKGILFDFTIHGQAVMQCPD